MSSIVRKSSSNLTANNSLLHILTHCSDIVVELDVSKEIMRANPAAESYFQVPLHLLLNKNIVQFCEENGLEYPKALNINEAPVTPIEETTTQQTEKNRFKAICWKIIPLIHHQEITGYLLLGKDLTQTVLNEKAIKNVEERLQLFIDSIAGYHWWKDLEGRYLGCNHAVAKLLGLDSPQEVIGKTDYELPWAENADVITANDQEVINIGKPVTNEEEIRTKNNEIFTFLVVKMPLKGDYGNIIGTIGSSINITELKNAQRDLKIAKEKAEAANLAKTEFISNMSHDIRTPVSAIIGIAEILEKQGANEQDRNYGNVMHTSSEQLLQLLNDILDVISAENLQETDIHYESFNLRTSLKKLEELLHPNTLLKKIHLEISIDKNLPELIICDRVKLERILLNLVGNAIKFTEKGFIRIEIKVLNTRAKNLLVEFVISDTGIGIPSSQINKVFDRFYRANPSYEGIYKGHGIGLYLVRKFISLLQGEIRISSELGRGTSVTFTLPMRVDNKQRILCTPETKNIIEFPLEEKPASIHANCSTSLTEASNGIKTLLIEDDKVARLTGENFLRMVGCDVTAVSDAETALNLAKSERYDLIVTDIGLPGMSGDEFTLVYRYWEKSQRKEALPIIGLSAHVSEASKKNSLSIGMDELYSKPLSQKKAAEIIARFISEKTLEKPEYTAPNTKKELGHELPATEDDLFQVNNYPLFDEEEGVKGAADDPQLLLTLIETLINETFPSELENLRKLHLKVDWNALREIAHKLKGAALYCGTVRMRYACQYFERYILAGHTKLAEPLYQQLLKVLIETGQSLQQWLKQKISQR